MLEWRPVTFDAGEKVFGVVRISDAEVDAEPRDADLKIDKVTARPQAVGYLEFEVTVGLTSDTANDRPAPRGAALQFFSDADRSSGNFIDAAVTVQY